MWGKITLTELVVHGWDIATATGQPFDLPEHTLQACFQHVATFVPNAPVPGLRWTSRLTQYSWTGSWRSPGAPRKA
jgi:hypothetical protein